MADLDDFFAKKDRKKSKGSVKKFATPEELVKSIEDAAAKKSAEAKTRKVTPLNPSEGSGGGEQKKPEQAEEEWKEFEEERKDYSGLKLAQLTISEQESAAGEEGSGSSAETEGEGGVAGSGNTRSGAWKSADSSDSADKQQQQQQQQQQQRAGSSVYVTPAMKNLRMKGKKGVAPDLKNEEFFPTLGTEVPVEGTRAKKDSTFEEVKHGGRVRASDLPSAQPLQVGNRFNSLSNDAS